MHQLVCKNLAFSYPAQPVLRDINLIAPPGKATILLGPSGSGKTTLLYLAAGLLQPGQGSVTYQCPTSADAPSRKISPPRMAMVFQQSSLWNHLTAERQLKLVLPDNLAPTDRTQRIDSLLDQFNLQSLRRRRPGQLSGGEQRRLEIARALACDPQWLLLDEPLAHIDGPTRTELFLLLRKLIHQSNLSVIMTTHNAPEALQLADQLVIILNGSIAQHATPQQIYNHPASLQVARLITHACQISGQLKCNDLYINNSLAIANLTIKPTDDNPSQFIIKPGDVKWIDDPAGPAEITACHYLGNHYLLTVKLDQYALFVQHHQPRPINTHGRLHGLS